MTFDEHYREQAALCKDMAAKASDKQLAAEWVYLANIWQSMSSRRPDIAEAVFKVKSAGRQDFTFPR